MDTSSWQISIYPSWLPPDLRCDFCKSSTPQHAFPFDFLPLRWFSKPMLVLSLQWKTTSSWNLSGNRVKILAHCDFSMGLFIGSWSPLILYWPFCIQSQQSLSSCSAYLEVVFEFEWIATYSGLLRAALILVPPCMRKWVWPLINRDRMFFVQSSTLPLSMYQKLTKYGRCCMLNKPTPDQSPCWVKGHL